MIDPRRDLCPGIVVFGRVKGFPWWPAVVSEAPHSSEWVKADGRVWCLFFEDPTGAWLRASEIRPFDAYNREECMEINSKSVRHRRFEERIARALEVADRYTSSACNSTSQQVAGIKASLAHAGPTSAVTPRSPKAPEQAGDMTLAVQASSMAAVNGTSVQLNEIAEPHPSIAVRAETKKRAQIFLLNRMAGASPSAVHERPISFGASSIGKLPADMASPPVRKEMQIGEGRFVAEDWRDLTASSVGCVGRDDRVNSNQVEHENLSTTALPIEANEADHDEAKGAKAICYKHPDTKNDNGPHALLAESQEQQPDRCRSASVEKLSVALGGETQENARPRRKRTRSLRYEGFVDPFDIDRRRSKAKVTRKLNNMQVKKEAQATSIKGSMQKGMAEQDDMEEPLTNFIMSSRGDSLGTKPGSLDVARADENIEIDTKIFQAKKQQLQNKLMSIRAIQNNTNAVSNETAPPSIQLRSAERVGLKRSSRLAARSSCPEAMASPGNGGCRGNRECSQPGKADPSLAPESLAQKALAGAEPVVRKVFEEGSRRRAQGLQAKITLVPSREAPGTRRGSINITKTLGSKEPVASIACKQYRESGKAVVEDHPESSNRDVSEKTNNCLEFESHEAGSSTGSALKRRCVSLSERPGSSPPSCLAHSMPQHRSKANGIAHALKHSKKDTADTDSDDPEAILDRCVEDTALERMSRECEAGGLFFPGKSRPSLRDSLSYPDGVLRALLHRLTDLEADVHALKVRAMAEEQATLGEDPTAAGLKSAVEAVAAASKAFAKRRDFNGSVIARALDALWPDGSVPLVGAEGEFLRAFAKSLVVATCRANDKQLQDRSKALPRNDRYCHSR